MSYKEKIDPATGRTYYYDPEHPERSTWNKPKRESSPAQRRNQTAFGREQKRKARERRAWFRAIHGRNPRKGEL